MEQKFNVRSKLTDGLLAAGVMVLLEVMLILFVNPILILFDRPGMLVYTVVLVALAAICLDRSLSNRDSEMTRAGWGIIGGIVTWVVIEFSSFLGRQSLINETGILNLMVVVLLASVIWRKLPYIGLNYFLSIALIGWLSQVCIASLRFLTSFEPRIETVFIGMGVLAAILMASSIGYIFFRSRTRLERLNAALVIWFSAILMIYVFRGSLF